MRSNVPWCFLPSQNVRHCEYACCNISDLFLRTFRVFDVPGTLMHVKVSNNALQLTEPEKPESKSEHTGTKPSAFVLPVHTVLPFTQQWSSPPINVRYGWAEPKHQGIAGSRCKNKTKGEGTGATTKWDPDKSSRTRADKLENQHSHGLLSEIVFIKANFTAFVVLVME